MKRDLKMLLYKLLYCLKLLGEKKGQEVLCAFSEEKGPNLKWLNFKELLDIHNTSATQTLKFKKILKNNFIY